MADASFSSPPIHTKIAYVDGRPTTITLRRCKLEVMGPDSIKQHTFDRELVTVGATADNDLVISNETVSRNHCRIFVEGGQYMIRDLNSTNGTFVDRVRIREAWLEPGCTIRLGTVEIRFASIDEEFQIVPSTAQRFGGLIGRHVKMREIYAILEKIAPTDATVVIGGETGTGKEVVARTVHTASRRADGPFMVFDCGAVPENLIESELFGHEKGAFTGAHSTRQGIFEMANGGTVFLDELGELAIDLQPKLLRVLEQREVRRVGGSKSIPVDVRVIAATNRKLEEEVREGRFREDLFYRLSVVQVVLPPLRERLEDLPLLVQHFLTSSQFNRDREGNAIVNQVASDTMARMQRYKWPGNVRELHNCVERAVSFADGPRMEPRHLPIHIGKVRSVSEPEPKSDTISTEAFMDGTFKNAKEKWVSSFEKDYIEHLLRKNDNNISHAAREAEIDRKYFRKLMKKYEIEVKK